MAAAAPDLVTPPLLTRDSFRAMGTEVTVLVPEPAGEAVALVRSLFDEWDRRFSRFREDSELRSVNRRAGHEVPVSPPFLRVASAALEAARATDGLFDPALADQMVALGYDRTFDALPADRPALTIPVAAGGGWRAIGVDAARGTVRLPPGIGLDFGGIAKGMAVDAAVATLAAHGATSCAVDAGGDLAVLGLPPGSAAWTVAIETPSGDQNVSLPWGALATSSVARRRWRRGGRELHHLLDPRTGEPAASGIWSASVAAGSCRQAEVAAKAALLLGPEHGAAFLRQHRLSGLLVLDDGAAIPVGEWQAAEVPA